MAHSFFAHGDHTRHAKSFKDAQWDTQGDNQGYTQGDTTATAATNLVPLLIELDLLVDIHGLDNCGIARNESAKFGRQDIGPLGRLIREMIAAEDYRHLELGGAW